MSSWATACAISCGLVVTLCICIKRQCHENSKRRSPQLPPGPPGLPWIGNVLGIDVEKPWLSYMDWAKTYGDLVYSRLLGKHIIIINSEKTARDLLEERSGNYSDRPHMATNHLCGIGFNTVMLPYGDRWRLHRRFFHQTFRLDVVHRFVPTQYHRSCQLLRRLLHTPEQFSDHVFEYTASVILNSVYDYDPHPDNDEMIDVVSKALNIIIPAGSLEVALIVGAFPALLKLPSWLPGMSFKRRLAFARVLAKQYLEKPFEYSLQRVPSACPIASMVHDALRHVDENSIPRNKSWMQNLKEAAATAFLAASESSNSVLMTFFLMMVANPEVQKRAQAQIDAVVGNARLPTINDRPSLPYVGAILREILRYNPPIPLSIPHATVHDDMYNGFHIPKGAIVMVNLWSIMHDESKYPNPYTFRPERFLDNDGSLKPNDCENIVFGFGRRVCVGRHFADTSLWAVIARVLAVFTISKALDENGAEIPVEPKFSGGPATHPLPFRCRIVPRIGEMDENKLEELIVASNDQGGNLTPPIDQL